MMTGAVMRTELSQYCVRKCSHSINGLAMMELSMARLSDCGSDVVLGYHRQGTVLIKSVLKEDSEELKSILRSTIPTMAVAVMNGRLR